MAEHYSCGVGVQVNFVSAIVGVVTAKPQLRVSGTLKIMNASKKEVGLGTTINKVKCAVFQRLVSIRGQCCKIERRTGEYNVSFCASYFKEFSSDEKDLNFCITTTTLVVL